ncbi:hypothetical protein CYL20_12860 [Pseudomonas palleroniana]|uniref:Uncharacterized protein n=1 Tax=Pseudomonas palleroniana TaxID=191390 RepID=A0A2L1JA93_9PSED|nr:hypothetical protein CYL20_12860 [Pseudomonas palleroniana]
MALPLLGVDAMYSSFAEGRTSAYASEARFIQSMKRFGVFAWLAIAANVPKAPLFIAACFFITAVIATAAGHTQVRGQE